MFCFLFIPNPGNKTEFLLCVIYLEILIFIVFLSNYIKSPILSRKFFCVPPIKKYYKKVVSIVIATDKELR